MPSERKRNAEGSPNEFGMVRSYLARQGVKQAQIKAVIGVGSQGRSRAEIVDLLKAWMHDLPKASTVAGAVSGRDHGCAASLDAGASEGEHGGRGDLGANGSG